MKDVPNRRNSSDKGMEACTSCHAQGLARGLVVLEQGPCPVPGVETNKEAKPDSEGPHLPC